MNQKLSRVTRYLYLYSLQTKIILVHQALSGGPIRYYYGPIVLREYPVSR